MLNFEYRMEDTGTLKFEIRSSNFASVGQVVLGSGHSLDVSLFFREPASAQPPVGKVKGEKEMGAGEKSQIANLKFEIPAQQAGGFSILPILLILSGPIL